MAWVTGPEITTAAGLPSPSAADAAWAATCAAAVDGAIVTLLLAAGLGAEEEDPVYAELTRAALLDGMAAYRDRDAPAGVLTVGPDGAAVRLGADILRAVPAALTRYTTPGIG